MTLRKRETPSNKTRQPNVRTVLCYVYFTFALPSHIALEFILFSQRQCVFWTVLSVHMFSISYMRQNVLYRVRCAQQNCVADDILSAAVSNRSDISFLSSVAAIVPTIQTFRENWRRDVHSFTLM